MRFFTMQAYLRIEIPEKHSSVSECFKQQTDDVQEHLSIGEKWLKIQECLSFNCVTQNMRKRCFAFISFKL